MKAETKVCQSGDNLLREMLLAGSILVCVVFGIWYNKKHEKGG